MRTVVSSIGTDLAHHEGPMARFVAVRPCCSSGTGLGGSVLTAWPVMRSVCRVDVPAGDGGG